MATANGETSATEANGGSASTSGRGDSPSPSSSTAALPTPTAHPPPQLPPFLNKCYDMVEDPSTDHMVSWGAEGNSFVIWDPHTFSKELLPKYFKHDNLASFVRQLNTYSFRKVDPDRWEFANDGFLKGQKHLLKTIVRKKASQVVAQPKKSEGKNASVKACIEVGKFGLEEEIQRLKRDKNILMQELVKIKQNQQTTDAQLRSVRERVQVMEQNQQQMLSFLAMAVQNPGFLAQVVQQNVNPRWTETNKKRRLPALEPAKNDENAPCDGQIVKYQPLSPENWKPFLTPVSNTVIIPEHDPLLVGINGLNLSVDDNHDISSIMKPYTQTEEEFLMDIPDDYLDQLLTNSPLEDTASVDLQSLDIPPIDMDFDFTEAEIGVEASNDLSMSSEQMTVEHLASEKNKEHKMV